MKEIVKRSWPWGASYMRPGVACPDHQVAISYSQRCVITVVSFLHTCGLLGTQLRLRIDLGVSHTPSMTQNNIDPERVQDWCHVIGYFFVLHHHNTCYSDPLPHPRNNHDRGRGSSGQLFSVSASSHLSATDFWRSYLSMNRP
jgi:hypothetical protein